MLPMSCSGSTSVSGWALLDTPGVPMRVTVTLPHHTWSPALLQPGQTAGLVLIGRRRRGIGALKLDRRQVPRPAKY